jgi:dTDP-4-dehydrorhamnose reductase
VDGARVRVLVTGAGGQVGRDLLDALVGRVPAAGLRCRLSGPPGPVEGLGIEVLGTDHGDLAVEDRACVLELVETWRPDVVFHAAAMTGVDACETDPDRAFAVNALGTRHVSEAATRVGAHLVYLSSDYVFDGEGARAYVEWDAPNPLSVYGRSKLAGEQECPPGATVVRTAWVAGAHGANMVKTVLRLAAAPGPLRFVDDQVGSPTCTADLAPALVTLGLERRAGVYHVTGAGTASWYDLARRVVELAGRDPSRVEPITTGALDPPRPARRPASAALDNAAMRLSGLPTLPPWQEGVERLVRWLGEHPS